MVGHHRLRRVAAAMQGALIEASLVPHEWCLPSKRAAVYLRFRVDLRISGRSQATLRIYSHIFTINTFCRPGKTIHIYDSHHIKSVSYTHLRAHETDSYLVCRLLLEQKHKHL